VLEGERAALRRVARGEDEGEREGRVEGCELEEAEDGVASYACLRTESVLGPRLEVCMSREILSELSSRHKTYLRARACTRFGQAWWNGKTVSSLYNCNDGVLLATSNEETKRRRRRSAPHPFKS
jgi:hypothetical protein